MLYRIGVGIAVFLGTVFSLLIALVFLGSWIEGNEIEPTPVAKVIDSKMSPEDTKKQKRWEERTEHWEYVNAFWSHIARITDDEVVESSESLFICGAVTQWVRQLNAAQVYARDWQRDYHEEDSLAKLEEFATAGHRLTTGFQTDCNQLQ